MHSLLRICWYTVSDSIRQKSFIASAVVCVALMFLMRGCFTGSYTINGQTLDKVNMAWQASMAAFSVVGHVALLIAILLSMRLFKRDKEDGSAVLLLGRPIPRWHYIIGRTSGVLVLSCMFMFLLHATIYALAFSNVGARLPATFLVGSLMCCVSVAFVVALVCFCSLFVSDVVSALVGFGIVAVSFASDSFYSAMNSSLVQSAMPQGSNATALWRVIWPKTTALMYSSTSWVSGTPSHYAGDLHPFVNVLVWSLLFAFLAVWKFNREEL